MENTIDFYIDSFVYNIPNNFNTFNLICQNILINSCSGFWGFGVLGLDFNL